MLAFVLNRRDTKETDQIISLFSNERGRLEAVSRGVKKITSKNSPALEPFALINVELTSGKEMPVLTTAQTVESFRNITQTLEAITAGQTVLSLVNLLTPTGQAEPEMWNFLLNFFRTLSADINVAPFFTDLGVLGLLSALGFEPSVKECVVSGVEITPQNLGDFSVADGGVRCVACARQGKPGVPLNKEVWGLLKSNLNNAGQIKISTVDAASFNILVYQFAVFHTGKKLANWR